MKHKFIVLFALSCGLVPLLNGCGKAPPSADNPPQLSAEEKAKFDAAAAKAAEQAPPVNAPPVNAPTQQ